MHTHTAEAAQWWARPRAADAVDHWIETYQHSLGSRHRTAILSAVQAIPDVKSVLEVGSHCGPNLMRLAQGCPRIEQLTGVEINAQAVEAGTRWAARLGFAERVAFQQGRVPDVTSSLPDACVDVVLSCYALAYIAPTDLDAVLYEMGRLARKAIIVAEPMDRSHPERMTLSSDYHEWTHDYIGASKWIGTWRGCVFGRAKVEPPVDRLGDVLIVMRENTPSSADMP